MCVIVFLIKMNEKSGGMNVILDRFPNICWYWPSNWSFVGNKLMVF